MSGLTELLGETSPEEERYFQTGGEEGPKESEADRQPAPETEPEPHPPVKPGEEPEPKEAAEAKDGEGEDADAADENKRVPLAALREERERRREMKEQLDRQAAMMQRLEGRFQQLLQPQQPQPQAPPPQPTADEDPIALLRTLEQDRRQQIAAAQQQASRQQFEQAVAQHEAQFMRQQPDYAAAAAFLQQRRAADLERMGVSDPQQRAQVLWQEAAGMAANAMQAGRNPAQVAYELARSWGYQPKGQEPAAAAPDKRIEMAQRAQEASGSLSASGGRSPAGTLSLEAIDKMSDEEFAKLSDAKWAKAWGA